MKDAYAEERTRMVERQIQARGVKDPAVLNAMRTVPRHLFVPAKQSRYSYEDRPLPIGSGQTISQPYIVALMTELLELKVGDKTLEIGTGSGYQSAILAALGAELYTIELIEILQKKAQEILEDIGYHGIHYRTGDGSLGWPENAPFDKIMVTAAPEEVPPALIGQLKPGGKMIIPAGKIYDQMLMLITKANDGTIIKENVIPVSFVKLTTI